MKTISSFIQSTIAFYLLNSNTNQSQLVQAFGFLCSSFSNNRLLLQRQQPCLRKYPRFTQVTALTRDDYNDDDSEGDDEQSSITPSELETLLQNSRASSSAAAAATTDERESRLRDATEEEIQAAERIAGNVAVPKTGISINDEMIAFQSKQNYVSQLFSLNIHSKDQEEEEELELEDTNRKLYSSVAAIQTVTTDSIGDEQMRYIVALDKYEISNNNQQRHYAMIDVPPYSDDLANQLKRFMNSDDNGDRPSNGFLSVILITCRDGIHYDESPAVYVTRKSDLTKWKQAFPNVEIVLYRLDTPRDCKDVVTQSLDGYGPWALDLDSDHNHMQFIETGRPLMRMEWDEDVQSQVLDDGAVPPDDNDDENSNNEEESDLYTPQAIRKKEEDKNILAVYTPGHTFGSVTYVFPKIGVCCSGSTMPVEDTRSSANFAGLSTAGPALDYRGYITTNSGSISKQIESARMLIDVYGDRYSVLLPSRGPPVTLEHLVLAERQRILHDMLNGYAELGRLYESMGII